MKKLNFNKAFFLNYLDKIKPHIYFLKNYFKKIFNIIKTKAIYFYKLVNPSKQMIIMLLSALALFGSVFAYKFIGGFIYYKFMRQGPPPVNVSAMKAEYQPWQPKIKSTGTLRAVQGISVTSEISGIIKKILFTPGAFVKEGDILIELNADVETAQLRSLEAIAELSKITYARDKQQFQANAVSQSTLDADDADLKNKEAQIASQTAIVAKKTIRAPFSGRLGISDANIGQYVNPGDTLVTLQAIDSVYVDFFVPQKILNKLSVGLDISLLTDTYPNQPFMGKITTINPIVDLKTRNVQVEALICNAESKLLPGMFGTLEVYTGNQQRFITLPQTAISFNPYGEIIYIIKETTKDKSENATYIANQSFVKVGETRGDQIAVLEGLNAGDLVVTSGQLKLKNGMPVVINNTVMPTDNPAPKIVDE